MVIVLEKGIPQKEKEEIRSFLEKNNFRVNEITGEESTIFGAVGHLSIDPREVEILPGVERVIPISKPYKMASREFKKENTIVEIPNNRGQIIRVGGMRIASIAGPCAVESREQIFDVARKVAASGAVMLRGGAYKPRTSPYAFQGMAEEGVKILKEAGDAFGLPVVTEIVSADHIPVMEKYHVDVLQIGARNMQNFELLKKVGAMGCPVILKRGLSATIEEWLMAAEYLLSSGTDKVILCERGIRTYEKATRNTLDLSAIPILRSLTHLPIIVDPSHAVGIRDKVPPMGLAAIAAGADGIIVEVHCCPEKAMSDGPQSLYPEQFDKLLRDIDVLAPVIGKETTRIRGTEWSTAESTVQQEKQSTELLSQGPVTCAYSGTRGAYAEQAIQHYFDGDALAISCSDFRSVFQAVQNGSVRFGMIPIENSLAGSVYDNYDNLVRCEDVTIAGSLKIRIEHSLLGIKGTTVDTIKTVYSHPQGLAQCGKFLSDHLDWEQVECNSTSEAARLVSQKNNTSCAAIASSNAAGDLEIIKNGIESDPRNYTRFLLIEANNIAQDKKTSLNGRKNPGGQSSGVLMATIAFVAKNQSGALHKCLGAFSDNGLNLTRLESRPVKGQPWRYMFYADIELTENDKNMDKNQAERILEVALKQLSGEAEDIRHLGTYREIN